MKKVLLLVLPCLVLLFSGCDQKPENEITCETHDVSYLLNRTEGIKDYDGSVIPDADTAVSIATAVFEGMEKTSSTATWTPQKVYYDEQLDVWLVIFWESNPNPDKYVTFGGDCCIFLNKSDGRVVRILYEY